ncbi:hypothetical protein BSKO_13394 [Bryopsis sp. KO-2023]|nr:hypothetical protein BSKO_13394 [Bryopsis sp. KO-2023]
MRSNRESFSRLITWVSPRLDLCQLPAERGKAPSGWTMIPSARLDPHAASRAGYRSGSRFARLSRGVAPVEERSFIESLGLTLTEWRRKCRAWNLKPGVVNERVQRNVRLLKEWGLPPEDFKKVVKGSMGVAGFTESAIEKRLVWMANYLGFTNDQVMRVVRSNPSVLNYSITHRMAPFVQIFFQAGYTKADVRWMIWKYPQVIGFSNRLDSLCDFFQASLDFARSKVMEVVVKHPSTLGSSIDGTLRPKIDFLMELGFDREEVSSIIGGSPQILGLSLEQNIQVKIAKLEGVGLEREDVLRVIKRAPSLLWKDFDKSVNARISWLQNSLTYSSGEALEAFRKCPRAFCVSLHTWKETSELLMDWAPDRLHGMDFLKRNPGVLTLSSETLEEKLDFATQVLKKSKAEVLSCPRFLLTSLDKAVLLRAGFVCYKEENPSEFSLGVFCSRKRFNELFDEEELLEFGRQWRTLTKGQKINVIQNDCRPL